jgi:hypothetical protein
LNELPVLKWKMVAMEVNWGYFHPVGTGSNPIIPNTIGILSTS